MSHPPIKSARKAASGIVLSLFVVLARAIIRKHHPRVIGITGSVGKTTTKEAVYHVLKENFHAERSRKNANTEWGITAAIIDQNFYPLVDSLGRAKIMPWHVIRLVWQGCRWLMRTSGYPEILVLELAADQPGDIRFFNRFLEYDIAIITNIGQVHLEFYKDQAQLTQEKLALVDNLKPGGLVIIDGDGKLTQDFVAQSDARKITFGWNEENDYLARLIKVGDINTEFEIKVGNDATAVSFPFGRQTILAALVATAVGRELGLDFKTIADRLVSFTPPTGRFEIDRLQRSITLINDAYNANPDSMKLALASLQDIARGRRVAILGGMKELGQAHKAAHAEVGRFVADKVDLLVAIDEDGRLIAEAAKAAGLADDKVRMLQEPDFNAIFQILSDNDTVLVKASRAVGLDKLAEAIKRRLSF